MNFFQTLATGFAFSVCIIYIARPLAVFFGLVDAPSARKHHNGHIPLVGGVSIYIALAGMCMLFPFWRVHNGTSLVLLSFPLLLVGMADDKWLVSARARVLVEVCCCLVAAGYLGIRLDDLGSLLPNWGGTLVLLAIPLTVIGMVGVVNALNMSDGVDGLAGGFAALTFTALAWLARPTAHDLAMQLTSCVAILLGFLVFNSRFFGRSHASIFMGDGGSMFIGFTLAWYLVMLSQQPVAVITPVSALWLFAVPLLDTVTVMSRRIAHGHSPFSADRGHLHHLLLRVGLRVNRTVLLMLAAHLICIVYGVASIHFMVPEWISFVLFVALFVAYFAGTRHAWQVLGKATLTQSEPQFDPPIGGEIKGDATL